MRKQFLQLSFLSLISTILFISCKKNDTPETPPGLNEDEVTIQADDQVNFSTQLDAVANDVNIILEIDTSLAGRLTDIAPGVCNATYSIDTSVDPKTITIEYDGANCLGNYSRAGTVVISMSSSTRWKNAGTALTVNYQDLVITRTADDKSIAINGSYTLTNVSGGLISDLGVTDSVVHRITSNGITVRFGDTAQRVWQVARQQTFFKDPGLVMKITGGRTDGSTTNIAEWGTNRFGRQFISTIREPLVFREDCNFRLVSGRIRHILPLFSADAIFGLDATGEPTTCPGPAPYYVKILWTGPNNNSQSVIFPY